MGGGSSLFRLPSGCPNGIVSISSRGVLDPLKRPMHAGNIPKIVQYAINNYGRNECVLLPSHGLCVTRPWHAPGAGSTASTGRGCARGRSRRRGSRARRRGGRLRRGSFVTLPSHSHFMWRSPIGGKVVVTNGSAPSYIGGRGARRRRRRTGSKSTPTHA